MPVSRRSSVASPPCCGLQGVEAGDRVAVHAAKTPETLALFFGCAQIGAVFLPLNTAYTLDEVSFFLGDAEPKLCVCAPEEEADIAALLDGRGRTLSISADSTGSFADAIAAAEPLTAVTDRGDDDLAALLYTSGTTGRSKGAMLTQNNLLSNTRALVAEWRFTARRRADPRPADLPHARPVRRDQRDAGRGRQHDLPRQASRSTPSSTQLPRATVADGRAHLLHPAARPATALNRDLVSHMRLFVSGSAPLLAETHVEFEARTGHRILERYGMTETGMNTSNPYEGERARRHGRLPAAGNRDPHRRRATASRLPMEKSAVSRCAGPNVFAGYWRLPEKTRTEFRPDGFFITGDVGMIDEDGYLHIVGRAKDLIISGGFNIYPKEIELVIDQVEGVVESAVIGLPHADFGEAPVAVIVGDEAARPAVEAAVATSLARFKQPKRLVFVSELPRNTMGKVQKAELRKQFGDLLSN